MDGPTGSRPFHPFALREERRIYYLPFHLRLLPNCCIAAAAVKSPCSSSSALFLARSPAADPDLAEGQGFLGILAVFLGQDFAMSGKRSFFAPKKKGTNPFDSDSDDGESRQPPQQRPARASSVPPPAEQRDSLFSSPSSYSSSSSAAPAMSRHYRNDFRDAGGVESQSVQELEGYAAYKAGETTRRVEGCVRIAEEMRETASKTLVTVHQQGQQIHRTHAMALDIDQDLSRSEKLLGDLGGLFSKKWKPKKNGAIRGPMLTRDDSFIRKGSHLEQRQKLGLVDHPPRSNPRQLRSEPTSALEKVELEKAKQDDALSDLSDILTELKGMAVDMGSEIERQTKAMGDAEKDYDELNFRVKGANARTRRLLGR
ncbi:hypothetical protein ACP70R_022049 [Stipagrostis hirtigluma subsp. patula]